MPRLPHRLARVGRWLFGRTDPIILMYHRVAAAAPDPWGLAVEPANFAAQMQVLAETRRPVALDWLVEELLAGRRPARAVAITFDDAYRDVLDNAKPILDRFEIPATVFVVTGRLGSASGFWWDRLASAVFGAAELPSAFNLSFVDSSEKAAIDMASASGNRDDLHLKLWGVVRLLGPEQHDAAVAEIAEVLTCEPMPDAPVMTAVEIGRLIESGRITVGAHTVSHPSLPSLSIPGQREEMAESRRLLESLTGQTIRRFAYPFGDYDERSEALAEEVGFQYAVSVNAGAANDGREIFCLPRYDVKNWSADEFRERLKWFG